MWTSYGLTSRVPVGSITTGRSGGDALASEAATTRTGASTENAGRRNPFTSPPRRVAGADSTAMMGGDHRNCNRAPRGTRREGCRYTVPLELAELTRMDQALSLDRVTKRFGDF